VVTGVRWGPLRVIVPRGKRCEGEKGTTAAWRHGMVMGAGFTWPRWGKELGGGGSGPDLRAAPRLAADQGRRVQAGGVAMVHGRCERTWAGETGTDAWAPTSQCRAAASVQKISNQFNSIQIISN
jgi:hypothetical protein